MQGRSGLSHLIRGTLRSFHDDVIKWNFPRYGPFVRGIHRSPVNSPHKGQWRGALIFSSICAWINGWENNRKAGDLRHMRAHYDVIVMFRWFMNVIVFHLSRRLFCHHLYIPPDSRYASITFWWFMNDIVLHLKRRLFCHHFSRPIMNSVTGPILPVCIEDTDATARGNCKPRTVLNMFMMTSSNGNIFRVTGHLFGEFTGHRWIPRTKASDTKL